MKTTRAASAKTASSFESRNVTKAKQSTVDSKRLKELEEKNTSLKLNVDSLEQERDFYFAKLRDIEILCADKSLANNQVVKAVQTILFATEEYDIQGLIKQAVQKNVKEEVEKVEESSAVDLQPATAPVATERVPTILTLVDQKEETPSQQKSVDNVLEKSQTQTTEVHKENVAPEAVALSKSPLLLEDSGVNFLEDNGSMDTLLKTSPFTMHNM